MSKKFFLKRKGQEEIIVTEKDWTRERLLAGINVFNIERFQNEQIRGRIEESNNFQIQNKISDYYDYLILNYENKISNRWDLLWKFTLCSILILFVIVTYSIYF